MHSAKCLSYDPISLTDSNMHLLVPFERIHYVQSDLLSVLLLSMLCFSTYIDYCTSLPYLISDEGLLVFQHISASPS
jgi:hypothetical protein